LVSNHHVIAKCKQVVVVSEIDLYLVRVITSSADADLAILKTSYRLTDFARIREAPLVLGEHVYAFGYPYIMQLRTLNMSDGIVSGVRVLGSPTLVQLSTPLQPGNSGGPIVDETGLVAGVVAARLKKGQNIGFGLQGEVLRNFLDKNKIDYAVSALIDPLPTVQLAEIATTFTRPLLCLVEDD